VTDLLVTSVTPRLGSGTGLRTYGVAAALGRIGAVELRYVSFGAPEAALEFARLGNVTLDALHASRGIYRGLEFARSLARGIPPDLARGVSPALVGAVDGAPASVRIIADGPVVAAALMPVARGRPIVYLAHNLESGGFRGRSGQRALRHFERAVLRTFAESWMATRADQQGATRLAGDRVRTRYVPNVVDTAVIEPVAPAGARRVLFVADFTYVPNREALRFLVDRVMPEVWSVTPEVRLLAVGRRGSSEVPADSRIEAPGFVLDLRDAYASADVVVVPLLSGGGSPLKFIEGLAYGLPVLASHHAGRLIEDGVVGRDFLTAAEPSEFAAAIHALLDGPGRAAAVGAAGRRLAVNHYSVETLVRLLSP
jgi:glycosyltransferase involved in cell wall biosynthesis